MGAKEEENEAPDAEDAAKEEEDEAPDVTVSSISPNNLEEDAETENNVLRAAGKDSSELARDGFESTENESKSSGGTNTAAIVAAVLFCAVALVVSLYALRRVRRFEERAFQ